MSLTLVEAAEALRHVAPDARETWVKMGMALKAEFGEEAFEVWDSWSAEAASYRAGDAKTTWRSFGLAGGVKIGSLIREAQQGGWTPAARTPEEDARLERERAERRRARKAAERAEAARVAAWQDRIAELAQRCLDEGVLSASGPAPYLGKKKVAGHGVRFVRRAAIVIVDDRDETTRIVTGGKPVTDWLDSGEGDLEAVSFRVLRRGTVAVPMRDADGRLWGWQFIFAAGGKQYLKHSRKSGCFHLIGAIVEAAPIALAEGYATAASVHEATGWPVAVCFDAGNLVSVAQALRARYPAARLIVCGDDDHETKEQAGRKYAAQAAAESRGVAVFPTFSDPAGRTDWNDLHREQGRDAVRAQLHEAAGEDCPTTAGGLQGHHRPNPRRPDAAGGGGDEPPDDWENALERDKSGRPSKNVYSLITILENHLAWRGVFELDSFAGQARIVRRTPYGAEPGPLGDVDGTEVAAWFADPANRYRMAPGSKLVLEAIEAVAARHAVHPVRAYLDGLTWDREERLEHLLADYFGAAYDEYTAAVSRNWLMSAVKRVREPACKVDFMVILEGRQGVGKSSAVRTLCGAEWFAEMLESPQNKDFYQMLSGRWIIEIPELQAFSKADRNRIKAAVSAQEDTYRPSYGRLARKFERQTIFVGTTNEDSYLKDSTGARRFMPIACGEIDIPGLAAIRDQLWAEADARLARGETYWEFPAQAILEQEARYDADVWEQPVQEWLDGHAREPYPHGYPPVDSARPVEETTLYDVMHYALKFEDRQKDRQSEMRLAQVMRRLGYEKDKRKTWPDGRRRNSYIRQRDR